MLLPAMTINGQGEPPTTDESGHVPVMLDEAVDALQVKPGGFYIDGTFGGGGHSARIAELAGAGGALLVFDRDPRAAEAADSLDSQIDAQIIFENTSFAEMADVARARHFEPVDGILLDLGISSLQLADAERGFSFQREGPLDMRMAPTVGVPASELIARLSEAELAEILFEFGEERQARRIARAIVNDRAERPIQTTSQLADLVERVIGRRPGSRIHPATRTFQALRIAVNDELVELQRGLEAALEILSPGGRLVVLSFHSLEDRIVKQFIAREVKGCICPPEQPVCTCGRNPRLRAIGRAQRPSEREIKGNPRARSATMRVAERLT